MFSALFPSSLVLPPVLLFFSVSDIMVMVPNLPVEEQMEVQRGVVTSKLLGASGVIHLVVLAAHPASLSVFHADYLVGLLLLIYKFVLKIRGVYEKVKSYLHGGGGVTVAWP